MISTSHHNEKIRSGAGLSGYVAELGSCLLGAELGLPVSHLDNHASYVGHWLRILKADERALLTAAARAEEAASYLINLGRHAVRNNDGADDIDENAMPEPLAIAA